MNSSQVVATQIEKVRTKVPVAFDRDVTFYSTIEKRDVEVVSTRDMRAPMELRPGGDFGGFDNDGGDLGRGDGPTWDKALISTVNMKFAVEWTAKSDWGTDNSRKAVVKTFNKLLSKSMAEFRRHVDSSCMTDGTGTLGTVSAVSTSGGVDTITLNSDGYGARLVRYGQRINIYDSTLATNRTTNNERRITFHDPANKQIKIAAVTGITVGDKIVVQGVSATPPTWLQGVTYHHSDASTGTWLGLDRSTTPEIRANRVNAGGALALPFARLALNKIGDRVGQEEMRKTTAWMHPCQKQAYEELGQLVSVIQKSAKDEALDLYFGDSMQMAGAPVKTHYSWNRKRIDFVVPEVWGRAEMKAADFYEVEGRRLFEVRGSSGGVATSTVFYIVASFNTFVSNPAVCAYIDGLSIPSGY
jgi:hypothetical protein